MRGLWVVFSFAPQLVSPDRWFGSDKVQHFVTSAFVQGMGYSVLRATGISHSAALAGASVATAAVGVGKEIHDRDVKRGFQCPRPGLGRRRSRRHDRAAGSHATLGDGS